MEIAREVGKISPPYVPRSAVSGASPTALVHRVFQSARRQPTFITQWQLWSVPGGASQNRTHAWHSHTAGTGPERLHHAALGAGHPPRRRPGWLHSQFLRLAAVPHTRAGGLPDVPADVLTSLTVRLPRTPGAASCESTQLISYGAAWAQPRSRIVEAVWLSPRTTDTPDFPPRTGRGGGVNPVYLSSYQGRRHGFWTGGAACPEKGPLAEGALFKVILLL